MATPRVAAGAIIRDPSGRILLVKPTYKEGWDIPGGYVEPGESPAAACRRELMEELRLDIPTGRLLLVDWAPAPNEGDKLLFVFDGGVLSDISRAVPDGAEIGEIRFVEPSEIESLMPARLVRRITSAIREHADVYAENGLVAS
jgi:8-oxo-dGTP diphosphatase